MRILLAVMSCQSHRQRAWTQRSTLLKPELYKHTDIEFFYGQPRPFWSGMFDHFLDVDDSRAAIPLKVQALFRWGAEHGYDYIAKCDDDVLIAPHRFSSLPLIGDLMGHFQDSSGGYPAKYPEGYFYIVSRRAAEAVAAAKWNGDFCDERWVANVIAKRYMVCYDLSSAIRYTGPHIPPRDIPKLAVIRDGAVFAEYRPDQMSEAAEALLALPEKKYTPKLVLQPNVTAADLAKPPTDRSLKW